MPIDKSKIKKVLVVSLTNIGDVVLTFPVVDILKENLPGAKISVLIGPKAESLLNGNPALDKIYVFNKHQPLLKTWSLITALRKNRFDLAVDLRNTAIPFLIFPRYKTSMVDSRKNDRHMRDNHIKRLNSIFPFYQLPRQKYALYVSPPDQKYDQGLIQNEIGKGARYIVISPGAAHQDKRWKEADFARVADELIRKEHVKIVLIGGTEDSAVAANIVGLMKEKAVNACGRTNLQQLAELIKHAQLAIVNDSAPLHIASYLDVPVLAIFGPSEPIKYGPWGSNCHYLKDGGVCGRCGDPKNSALAHTCMASIKPEDVLNSFEISSGKVVFKK